MVVRDQEVFVHTEWYVRSHGHTACAEEEDQGQELHKYGVRLTRRSKLGHLDYVRTVFFQ